MRGVVPHILMYVIVLTPRELSLIIGIIATEGVDHPVHVDSGEESLFLWHLGSYLQGLMVKVKASVDVSIPPQDVVADFICDKDQDEVAGEFALVASR